MSNDDSTKQWEQARRREKIGNWASIIAGGLVNRCSDTAESIAHASVALALAIDAEVQRRVTEDAP